MLNRELVREGFCWWYRKYVPGDATLEKMEADSRESQRCLQAELHLCRHGRGDDPKPES